MYMDNLGRLFLINFLKTTIKVLLYGFMGIIILGADLISIKALE